MPVTLQELDRFHEFATQVVRNGGKDMSFDELIAKWQAAREREDIHAAIREGIDDLKAGRTRPADEVMSELRHKYKLRPE